MVRGIINFFFCKSAIASLDLYNTMMMHPVSREIVRAMRKPTLTEDGDPAQRFFTSAFDQIDDLRREGKSCLISFFQSPVFEGIDLEHQVMYASKSFHDILETNGIDPEEDMVPIGRFPDMERAEENDQEVTHDLFFISLLYVDGQDTIMMTQGFVPA